MNSSGQAFATNEILQSLRKYPMTIGTGDCLGMATPGHIRAIKKFQVHPVLAQQSIRENAQTGRNFTQVIQDAAWAVFQNFFRDQLYQILIRYEEDYWSLLENHFEKHLNSLGVPLTLPLSPLGRGMG